MFMEAISTGLAGAGSIGNYMSQQQTNRSMETMSRDQMNFQERMSNTAHQREVQDLMAAGLNPNLSAGGNGSSTPTGSMPSLQAPKIDIPDILGAISVHQQQQKIDLEAQRVAADIGKKEVDKDLTRAKTKLTGKGLIRSEAEGELSKLIKDGIKDLRQKYNYRPKTQNQIALPPQN